MKIEDNNTTPSISPKYGKLLKDPEVAEQIGMCLSELRNRRSKGKTVPKHLKLGSRFLRTPQLYVDEFIEAHLIA